MSKFSLVLFILFFGPSYGNVALSDFFPFGPSNGDTIMARGDDNSSAMITIPNFPFFGSNYTALWVNINGGISFRSPIFNFTPSCVPLSLYYSMIAPYWADVDITNTGEIYYRQSTDIKLILKAKTEIIKSFPNFTNTDFTWLYIATWYNVTYYPDNCPSCPERKRDTFQAILVSNGVHSFAIFYYNNITWTTGDASGGDNGLGGTPAFAGFDSGDGQHRLAIQGSCNNSIINIANESNVYRPGVFVFRIDDYNITQPPTTPQPPSTLSQSTGTSSTAVYQSTPSQSTTIQPAISTTPGPINPLSNGDGTPCNCNPYGRWMDLILIIDRSRGVGDNGLTDIAGQIAAALDSVPIATTGKTDFFTRVGLIVFSSDVVVVGNLTTYTSNDQLIGDLFSLSQYYMPGDNIVDIGKALKAAYSMFQAQSRKAQRNVPRAVILYASGYNQISDDPKAIASQMNNSNIFITTVDYNDNNNVATTLLSQISTPYMNFSSNDPDTVDELKTATCYANCLCPAQSLQLKTFNSTTYKQTYYADCLQGVSARTTAKYAEDVCEARNGSLVSLTSAVKNSFMFSVVINSKNSQVLGATSLHLGLHRNNQSQWAWWDYKKKEYPLGNYQNWAPGFNASSKGDYVYIDQYGANWGWVTEGVNSNSFMYICQVHACDSAPTDCDRTGWSDVD